MDGRHMINVVTVNRYTACGKLDLHTAHRSEAEIPLQRDRILVNYSSLF